MTKGHFFSTSLERILISKLVNYKKAYNNFTVMT